MRSFPRNKITHTWNDVGLEKFVGKQVRYLGIRYHNYSIDCSSRRPARCTARRTATVAPCSVRLLITDFFFQGIR